MNCWYWHASARELNPSETDMEKFRGDFQTLYQKEETHTPGLPLTTHVKPVNMNNNIPLEAEVEAAVCRLCPHRAVGHTHLLAEHSK